MIVKTTPNRSYPKPDVNNSLQDDVANIENALHMIDQDIHSLNTTKSDQSAVEILKEKIYNSVFNINGPTLAFQYAVELNYSIEIPNATSYTWTASNMTITNGENTKSITVTAGATSGSVSVTVTNGAGETFQRTKAVEIRSIINTQSFVYTGTIVSWTVPENIALIKIEAWGGQGEHGYLEKVFKQFGGKGARMSGLFKVNSGDKLLILVGQKGQGLAVANQYIQSPGGGGGGSFVVLEDPTSPYQMTVAGLKRVTPLLIAGGGGGGGIGGYGQPYDGGPGLIGTSGGEAFGRPGGSNGSGGLANRYGGGGAGFSGDGSNADGIQKPLSFLNGGLGGTYNQWAMGKGGFGGGGGAGVIPGGGGGYSGGRSEGVWSTHGYASGGGSFNAGFNQNNTAGVREGDGKVEISW